MDKKRLDLRMVEDGLEESREKAKALIMSGCVFVNDQKETKAGYMCQESDVIEVRGRKIPYVSRGGLKLEKALDWFGFDPAGLRAIDIGASTGGFTDVLLQRGADQVFALDVGYGQLAWKIRSDPRVVTIERTNIRYADPAMFSPPLDLAVTDVSFISLKLVFPKIKEILSESGNVFALIKPQFEAGREKVGKKGVVRDPAVHEETITNVFSYAKENGFKICGLTYSPIRGPEGNIEYLLWLKPGGEDKEIDVPATVKSAFEEFEGKE